MRMGGSMILTEVEIKVKAFTMLWESANLLYYYITMPDGETYCYKQEDFNKNKTFRLQRYAEEKQPEVKV